MSREGDQTLSKGDEGEKKEGEEKKRKKREKEKKRKGEREKGKGKIIMIMERKSDGANALAASDWPEKSCKRAKPKEAS